MKKFIIVTFSFLFLAACGNSVKNLEENNSSDKKEVNVLKLSDIQNVGFQKLEEGEALTDKTISVVKDMKCSKEKKPVCGKIGTMLNGYLNKCEAERHGAEVISQGFCKLEALKEEEKCTAEFLTVGNCAMNVEGFIFDQDAETCKKVSGDSCEGAQVPFNTKEDCEKSCSSK